MSIPRPATDQPPRCLILHQGASNVVQSLLRGLRQRSIEPTSLPHPAAIMAALPQHQPQFVIIVEPDRVPWLPQLRAAIARYYPAVRLWQYAPDPDGHLQLSPLTGVSTTTYKLAPKPPPPPLAPALASQPLPDLQPPEPLLTPEEIEMLLSPGKPLP